MEMLSNLGIGLETAFQWHNLFYCFVGALLGTLVGVLPGIGPTATIAMLLPLTFTLGPETALIMLAGIYYGAQYGGSTTAILLNLPGEASSAVTAIDGYQMARQGQGGPALAIAAIGSFFAGTVATFVIVFCAPLLTSVALKFGPVEYFALISFGLVCSVTLAHGSILKAVAMIVLGLLLGMVGTDINSGVQRFTFGQLGLFEGINVVALAVGIFGLSEVFRNFEPGHGTDGATVLKIGRLMPSREQFAAARGPILRGTVLGSLLGVLPGGGALLSSFASYALERRISKTPERFGKGAIEGVAGPESANNAGGQTSFIPMLTLGLPSNAVMAMMIGAMVMQGITPGPAVAVTHPALFWGLIASMWVGNLMLVVLNLPLVGLWVRLLTVPYWALFPAIVTFSAIGIYSVHYAAFDLFVLVATGVGGYLLIKLGFEVTPLLLGFILGPMMEEYLRRAMVLSRGDPVVFLTSPISAFFLVCALVMLLVAARPSIRQRRAEIFVEED